MAGQLHCPSAYTMMHDNSVDGEMYPGTSRFATSSERDTPLPPRLQKSYSRSYESSATTTPRLTIRIPPMSAAPKPAERLTITIPPLLLTPDDPRAQAWVKTVRASPHKRHALPSDPRFFLMLALDSYYRPSLPEHWLFWGGVQQAKTIERVEELNADNSVRGKVFGVYPWVGARVATWHMQHMHGFGTWDAELRVWPQTWWYAVLFPTMPEVDKGEQQKAKEAAAREREDKQLRRVRAKAEGMESRVTRAASSVSSGVLSRASTVAPVPASSDPAKGTKRTRSCEKDESAEQPDAKRACRTSSRLRTKTQDAPQSPSVPATISISPPPLTRASSTMTDITIAVPEACTGTKEDLIVDIETVEAPAPTQAKRVRRVSQRALQVATVTRPARRGRKARA